METSSSFNASIASPISRVPYDVLREIFIHCLPRYRLKARQPNAKVSPMLLCQICSSWRIVALNSPVLWSHLSYCLICAEDESPDNELNFKILKNQWAFLSWWMRNQGTMTPSLCFDITWRNDGASGTREPGLDTNEIKALFEYIASARYLEVEEDFWNLIYEWNDVGDHDIYPNPHTLVRTGYEGANEIFYRIQGFIQDRTPSALRHLLLNYDILPNDFLIPNHWTHLTHVAFDLVLPLNIWFSFIRSVPDLQWGHFSISLSEVEHIGPAKCILRHLSTFFLNLCDVQSSAEADFPLSTLFAHLHLPVLHTLSLFSSRDSWSDQRGVAELYTVLDSTPAITTLTLSDFVLSSNNYLKDVLPGIGAVEPIWRHAPLLRHLRLELPEATGHKEVTLERIRNRFTQNLFYPGNHWLGLDDPTCTIRKITMIDGALSGSWADMMKHLIRSRIWEYKWGAPNVNIVFDIISDLENPTASGAWNEWGPNLIDERDSYK